MSVRQGKCINFGNCPKADSRSVIEVADGAEFVCPEAECGKALQAVESTGGRRLPKGLLVGVGLVVVAIAVWALRPSSQYPTEPPQTAREVTQPGDQPTGSDKGGQQQPQKSIPCGLQPVSQPDVNRLLTYLKQGMTYASQSQYDLALKEFEQVRQIDPNFLAMHENIAAAHLKLKQLPEAETHLQAELKLIGCLEQTKESDLPKFAYMLEVARDGKGNPDSARALTMRERLKQAKGVAHYNLACVRARQGASEQSIDELRQAVASGFSDTSALKRDPDLASVRSNPGFQNVVAEASSRGAGDPK